MAVALCMSLITASCSFHVRLPDFLGMLALAAGDSGRRIRMRRILGAGLDVRSAPGRGTEVEVTL